MIEGRETGRVLPRILSDWIDANEWTEGVLWGEKLSWLFVEKDIGFLVYFCEVREEVFFGLRFEPFPTRTEDLAQENLRGFWGALG